MNKNIENIGALVFVLMFTLVCYLVFKAGSQIHKENIRYDNHSNKLRMKLLYPTSYKDSSGVASITLTEETSYCFDSAMNKQWVETYKPEILLKILLDLQYAQANVSYYLRPDSIYVAEWDNVYYIPRVVNLGEPKAEKK